MKKYSTFIFGIVFLAAVVPARAETAIGQVVSVNEADGSLRIVSADGRERMVRVTGDTRMFGAARAADLRPGDSVTVSGDANFVSGELNAAAVERVGAPETPVTSPVSESADAAFAAAPAGSVRVTSAPLVSLENRRVMASSPIDNTVATDRSVSPALAREESARVDAGIVSTPENSSPVDNVAGGDRFVSRNLAREEAASTDTTTA